MAKYKGNKKEIKLRDVVRLVHPRPEIRRFINKFIHRVVVHTDNIEVTFKVAFLIGEKWTSTYCFTKWLNREAIKFGEYPRNMLIDQKIVRLNDEAV